MATGKEYDAKAQEKEINELLKRIKEVEKKCQETKSVE